MHILYKAAALVLKPKSGSALADESWYGSQRLDGAGTRSEARDLIVEARKTVGGVRGKQNSLQPRKTMALQSKIGSSLGSESQIQPLNDVFPTSVKPIFKHRENMALTL